ncbi:hypothetical protein P162_0031 [Lactococcus phage P162]|uniref:Uncharacterized protein n=1 Tax=Lactococcus phage P162 TaxID=1476889 RepID=X4YUY7_9CAUD|nr:hypothetical protein GJ24_gp31 [Lactococcus phage P162]AHV83228.1 hypothetical protein P162_0031 [Lactococcus phage P162]
MKNIKQSIKNKAKATGEFISEHADIIIPVAVATVTITYSILQVKRNNKLIKEREVEFDTLKNDVYDIAFGSGVAWGQDADDDVINKLIDANEFIQRGYNKSKSLDKEV